MKLRPFLSTIRTALLIYLTFTVIIVFLNSWSKTGIETSASLPSYFNKQPRIDNNLKKASPVKMPTGTDEVDLTYFQKTYQKNWEKILVEPENNYRATVKFYRSKLQTKHIGRDSKTIKWIYGESAVVLPESASEEKAVKLGSEWVGLAEKLGLTVNIKSGYTNQSVWFTLSGFAGLGLLKENAGLTLPKIMLIKVNIIQPLGKAQGKRPDPRGLIPQLRPQFNNFTPPDVNRVTGKREVLKTPVATVTPAPVISTHPLVALIIDDIGFTKGPADEMLKIHAPLTWSVLPFTPYASIYIDEAQKKGFEIILHLPLEPLQDSENPGPGVIKQNWSDQEIIRQFNDDLQQVPGAIGVNNHMGSSGTQNVHLMQVLMEAIKKKKLFFVDSFTVSGSVAEKCAGNYRVPFAKRNVFIDNDPDLESKKEALRKLIKLALKDGVAVGIAHAREGSAEAIREMLPEFKKAGIDIVPVSKLVK